MQCWSEIQSHLKPKQAVHKMMQTAWRGILCHNRADKSLLWIHYNMIGKPRP
jgi:hypothetical protein